MGDDDVVWRKSELFRLTGPEDLRRSQTYMRSQRADNSALSPPAVLPRPTRVDWEQ